MRAERQKSGPLVWPQWVLANIATGALIMTVTGALVYFGSVAVLQALYHAVTDQQQSQLVIKLSKLAIAAFSAVLREELDLDQLETVLLSMIEETFQPESLSLWRREASQEMEVDHVYTYITTTTRA